MKSLWREILMAIGMGMILPGIVLNYSVEDTAPSRQHESITIQLTQPQPEKISLKMKLRLPDGTLQEMEMDEYLVGVILGELPANFEAEAKKAQAVAARTFARKAAETGGKHGDGSVCTNAGCCQAYCPESEYLGRGGSQEAVRQAQEAVLETSGYVLTYQGELIEATYFSCSGGTTEDAVAVWGTDFPYLRATSSPGEEHAVHYTDTVYFTKKELEDKLGITLDGSYDRWLGNITYTSGNGVKSILIGGKSFTGTQVRSLLGLRSTAFTMSADSGGITVVTRGFGHRVGMSQYGADAMAASGSSWQEILNHYYPGTTLELTKSDG